MKSINWQDLAKMPGSKDVGAKKYRILEVSLEIISQEASSLSVTSISKASGLSKSLVLYHYSSIELILADLLFYTGKMARFFIEKNLARCKEGFEERVSAMLSAIYEWVLHHKPTGDFFILMFHEGDKSPEMEKILVDIYQNAMHIWERIFLESMRYSSMQEVRQLTQGVHHLITGSFVWMAARNDLKSYQKNAAILHANVETLLGIRLPAIKLEF